MKQRAALFLISLIVQSLLGCQASITEPIVQAQVQTEEIQQTKDVVIHISPTIALAALSTPDPPPTITPFPTTTATSTPIPTITPSPTPTPTPLGQCDQRLPEDDLLTFVTLEYGLHKDYVPNDLVPLDEYLPIEVTLGYPTQVRKIILDSLVQMIDAMVAEELIPKIISGYRSYSSQAIAWEKWNKNNPESAAIISAPPGHSEHQLGTVIDFGSPELPDIVGEDIEFHTYFYKTSEGIWLSNNAHRYGFTLSYSREAFDVTGFYYEPWHFRYVGVELATQLQDSNQFLAQYLLDTQPLPCIP